MATGLRLRRAGGGCRSAQDRVRRGSRERAEAPRHSRQEVRACGERADEAFDVVDGVVEMCGDSEVVVARGDDDLLRRQLADELLDVGRANADERTATSRV